VSAFLESPEEMGFALAKERRSWVPDLYMCVSRGIESDTAGDIFRTAGNIASVSIQEDRKAIAEWLRSFTTDDCPPTLSQLADYLEWGKHF
jgi:hypothetical protein